LLKLRGRPERDYISAEDPAVEKHDTLAYMRSGFDPKHVALKPGASPTVFKIRALSRGQAVALDLRATSSERSAKQDEDIVKLGLRGVQNLPGVEFKTTGAGDAERVDDEVVNQLLDNVDLRRELALMIVHLSSLVPLDA